MYRLDPAEPKQGGNHFLLQLGRHSLGSAAEAAIRLEDASVSRRHAQLLVHREGLTLLDAGSKNGSFLNGRRVRKAQVRLGDRITFGRVGFVLAEAPEGDREVAIAFPGMSAEVGIDGEDPATWTAGPDGEARPVAPAKDRFPELRWPESFVAGSSPAMGEVYRRLAHHRGSTLPLLLVGETGTGKDRLAQLIHRSSPRRQGPLVPVHCAAIPGELLEAELFGIEEKVATGVRGRRGKVQEAQGGTLFLDEIGEMPLSLQVKLLRFLDHGVVEPVGGRPRSLDVRVVAATNADLPARIFAGSFRQDLYYRLAGVVVTVPPLRRRQEDMPELVSFALDQAKLELTERGRGPRGLSRAALERLQQHSWPGNVRELLHKVRQLALQCPAGGVLDSALVAAHLADLGNGAVEKPPSPPGPATVPEALPTLDLDTLERRAIEVALRRSLGRIGEAAAVLGISRFTLRRKMQRHGIEADAVLRDQLAGP